jgi:hypothetical protein
VAPTAPIITRSGAAPLQPESVESRQSGALERNRHPETGKFIPTAAAPVKHGGSRPRGKVRPRP